MQIDDDDDDDSEDAVRDGNVITHSATTYNRDRTRGRNLNRRQRQRRREAALQQVGDGNHSEEDEKIRDAAMSDEALAEDWVPLNSSTTQAHDHTTNDGSNMPQYMITDVDVAPCDTNATTTTTTQPHGSSHLSRVQLHSIHIFSHQEV